MKLKKPFFFGFASGIVFMIIVPVGFYFIFVKKSAEELKEAVKNLDGNQTELVAYTFPKASMDSLTFFDLDSEKLYSITDDTHDYTFINYWATWCAPCVAELPEFDELVTSNQNKFDNTRFIFASREENDKINDFINEREFDISFSSYSDSLRPHFINHTSIPTSYLIDEKNAIAYKFSGVKKWNTEFYKKLLLNL
jgi:thiol-disulfide isomerase/thioredoxin